MARTDYQFRAFKTAYIERARDTLLTLEAYSAGSLSAPSSGTISIVDSGGAAVVDGEAITVTGSKATYTALTATWAAKALGGGWLATWSLVMDDGYTHEHRQDVEVVRSAPHCPISDVDLTVRHPDLLANLPAGTTTLEAYILEAWWTTLSRLESAGRRPYLVLSPAALRPLVQATALSIIGHAFAGDGREDNRWTAMGHRYAEAAEAAWSGLTLVYDDDDDALIDPGVRTGKPGLWLAGRAHA
jgi:hypothetical protein